MRTPTMTSLDSVAVSYLLCKYDLEGLESIAFDLGKVWVSVNKPDGESLERWTWESVGTVPEVRILSLPWSVKELADKACRVIAQPEPCTLWECFCPDCVRLQLQWHEAEKESPWGELDDREERAIAMGLEL